MGCLLVLVVIGGIWLLSTTSKYSAETNPAAATLAPAAAAVQPSPHIGSYVEDSGWRISLRQSDLADSITINDGGIATTYPAKGTWVVLLIELTNLSSRGSATLRLNSFALRDSRGTVYAPAGIYRLYARGPGYGELGQAFPPLVPLVTNIYFDVGPGTNGMVLLVAPGGPFPTTQIRVE